ncbi:MAG: hypothetical protein U0271_26575 [Polyangiaceae bacterium]
MVRSASFLVALLFTGCGSQTTEHDAHNAEASATSPSSSASVVATVSAAPLAPASTAPIAKLELTKASCSIAAWDVQLAVQEGSRIPQLCDERGEHCFVEAVGDRLTAPNSDMRATIAHTANPAVLIELPYSGIVFRGFLSGPPRIFPAKPVALNAYYVPVEVRLAEGRDDKVLVSAEAPSWFKPKKPIEGDLACADVAWSRPPFDFDGFRRLAGVKGDGEVATLKNGPIDLFTSSKGQSVATLETDDLHVDAYQSDGGRRLVLFALGADRVFGWVAKDAVTTLKVGYGIGSGNVARLVKPLAPELPGTRCDHDVRVLALVDGARLEVGVIRSNTVFTTGEWIDEGHRRLVLRHPRYLDKDDDSGARETQMLQVARGAKLAVLKDELSGCTDSSKAN